jgi:hypothetical protein
LIAKTIALPRIMARLEIQKPMPTQTRFESMNATKPRRSRLPIHQRPSIASAMPIQSR